MSYAHDQAPAQAETSTRGRQCFTWHIDERNGRKDSVGLLLHACTAMHWCSIQTDIDCDLEARWSVTPTTIRQACHYAMQRTIQKANLSKVLTTPGHAKTLIMILIKARCEEIARECTAREKAKQ